MPSASDGRSFDAVTALCLYFDEYDAESRYVHGQRYARPFPMKMNLGV